MQLGNTDPRSRVTKGSTDRAVSPVIGVILMVAITVVLAAVIGVFVLGLGDQVSNTAPSASLSFDPGDSNNVSVSHDGGDALDTGELTVFWNGTEASNPEWEGEAEIEAGEELELNLTAEASPDDEGEIRIRHDESDSIVAEDDDVEVGS